MTDRKHKTEAPAQDALQALDDAEMDRAAGGWGKTGYYSYSEGQSASYTTRSSGDAAAKPGRTTHANTTLEGGGDD